MKIVFIIILFFIFQSLYSQTIQYPYKLNRPTAEGIDQYVKNNKYIFFDEFQSFIKDTIVNDVDMTAEDLSKETDYTGEELGWTEIYSNGYQIIINNIKIGSDFIESDQFVKSTIFHELMHVYFRQEMLRLTMIKDSIGNSRLNKYYYNVQLIPNVEMRNGSKFIEEGLCEYLIHAKGEVKDYNNLYTPKTEEDINAKENGFNVYYKYSYEYLKHFMDSCFLADGYMRKSIHMLLTNNPPNHKEILNPKLYFNRLK